MTRTVDMHSLDDLAGEWRSVHNLLMGAAVVARSRAVSMDSNTDKRFAEACERVALQLSEREATAA